MSVTYLDSSAIVKLIVREPESASLRRFVRGRDLATSAIARTEVGRAVRPHGPASWRRATHVFQRIGLLALDDELLDQAAVLEPSALRSLDAIHLASALACGEDLADVVTYDARMAEAATEMRLHVRAPR